MQKKIIALHRVGGGVVTDADGCNKDVELFEDLSEAPVVVEELAQSDDIGFGCPPGFYYDARRGGCVPILNSAVAKARRKCPPGFFYDARRDACVPVLDSDLGPKSIGDWFSTERKASFKGRRYSTGWRPSIPDRRDFPPDEKRLKKTGNPKAQRLANVLGTLRKSKRAELKSDSLPPSLDLRDFCAEVEDQGRIGSCTAHAVVGLVEYFARRRGDIGFQGSRLFNYKIARRFADLVGDSGAFIRTAMGAAVACGVPPERYWPYTDDPVSFDTDPDNFVFSLAQNFQALSYFRYDAPSDINKAPDVLLNDLKHGLYCDLPFALGFYGFPSFDHPEVVDGEIPFPGIHESADWGHAVMAVGYDDAKVIQNPVTGQKTKGVFIVRNSWGKDWGDNGYGWLPYDYVRHGLAEDFWSLVDMEWLEGDRFRP